MTSPVVKPSQNGVAFLDHVCKVSILNVSFSVLTKRWAMILLSKIIRRLCNFRKTDTIYMLILVSMDL